VSRLLSIFNKCVGKGLTVALTFTLSLNAFADDWVYTTKEGDTLWSISKRYLNSESEWQRLKDHNEIANPRTLPPGKKLYIPYSWLGNKPANVVLLSFSGKVQIFDANGNEKRPKSGLSLGLGASINTLDASFAIIEFADKSTLFVRENTNVNLNKITYIDKTAIVDTQVRLKKGGVESNVIPFKRSGNRFEIITPAAVAAVRGTVFQVSLDSSNNMQSEVIEGSVKVKNEFGEKILPAGFGNIVQLGQAPSEPETLLPAPDLNSLKKVVLEQELKFNWAPIDGAEQYRVLLSIATKPVKILFDERAFKPVLKKAGLEKGKYAIQVRGIAKSGLQGLPSTHTFNFGLIETSALEAARLNTPVDAYVAQSNVPTLHWFNVENADAYRVQVSNMSDFSELIYDELVEAQFFGIPTRIKNGVYYWRVAGVKDNAQQGAFSTPFQLNIQ